MLRSYAQSVCIGSAMDLPHHKMLLWLVHVFLVDGRPSVNRLRSETLCKDRMRHVRGNCDDLSGAELNDAGLGLEVKLTF